MNRKNRTLNKNTRKRTLNKVKKYKKKNST